MKVLVTGASGFVGSRISEHLIDASYEVYVLVREKSSISAKIADKAAGVYRIDDSCESIHSALMKSRPDIVIHLASSIVNSDDCRDVDALIDGNLRFGTRLLSAMKDCGCRKIINTSTIWQYYNGSSEYSPVNLYAATKEAFEKILFYYYQARGIGVINLVLSDTYGPDDARKKLLPYIFDKIRKNEDISLTAGEQEIDLLYVEDVARAYVRAVEIIEESAGTIWRKYRLSSGKVITVRQLFSVLNNIFAEKLKVTFGAIPYRPRENMKIENFLEVLPGWTHTTGLEEGIAKCFGENIRIKN